MRSITMDNMGVENWDDIAPWWIAEVDGDPAYGTDVHPLYRSLLPAEPGIVVDLGCGEGQAMPFNEGWTVGVDLSHRLLIEASTYGPCVRSRLPDLSCFGDGVFDTAVSIYLLDLISDESRFFSEIARVVKPGGALAIVINHPVCTSPGSAPIGDTDGEVLWRWGSYHSRGSSFEIGGGRNLEFFHRPLDVLLNEATSAGWILERIDERPLSDATIERLQEYVGQEDVPRLLGVRWRNSAVVAA
jgi:SAM-dependent methyltransferase